MAGLCIIAIVLPFFCLIFAVKIQLNNLKCEADIYILT